MARAKRLSVIRGIRCGSPERQRQGILLPLEVKPLPLGALQAAAGGPLGRPVPAGGERHVGGKARMELGVG